MAVSELGTACLHPCNARIIGHSWLRLHFYVAAGDFSSDPQAFTASDLIFLALVLSLNSFILNCRSTVFGAKFSLI